MFSMQLQLHEGFGGGNGARCARVSGDGADSQRQRQNAARFEHSPPLRPGAHKLLCGSFPSSLKMSVGFISFELLQLNSTLSSSSTEAFFNRGDVGFH